MNIGKALRGALAVLLCCGLLLWYRSVRQPAWEGRFAAYFQPDRQTMQAVAESLQNVGESALYGDGSIRLIQTLGDRRNHSDAAVQKPNSAGDGELYPFLGGIPGRFFLRHEKDALKRLALLTPCPSPYSPYRRPAVQRAGLQNQNKNRRAVL